MKKLLIGLLLATVALAQSAHYRHHGQALLPDPQITPGVVTVHDVPTVCKYSNASDPRKVTEKMKNEVCMAYGLKPHCEGRTTNEIDHLVPRELGGADDIKNLWPQSYAIHPGAHEKDKLENWLHKQVCAGKMPLEEAQKAIATDWYAEYLKAGLDK